MNVVFDHQIFQTQKYGGISRYFFELAKGLNSLPGVSAKVVAPFHPNEYLRTLNSGFLRSNYFLPKFRGEWRISRYARKILMPVHYQINSGADIIHETYYSAQPNGNAFARVITVYDMIHELFADSAQFKNDHQTTEYKKISIKRADHVICISESTRKDLVELFDVPFEKTSVVYLGHALIDSANSLQRNFESKKPYLLYVGSRDGYKNFFGLLNAYAQSNFLSSEFDLIAFGGGQFNCNEMQRINDLGLMNSVHQVTGDDALLASYYRNAHAFIYPSLYEGFGIPPLEAMNYGCPVACSNVSSIPEVVGDAGVYFDPYSVESIGAAIEQLVVSSDLRNELQQRGRDRLNIFTWDRCVEETAEIYRSLV